MNVAGVLNARTIRLVVVLAAVAGVWLFTTGVASAATPPFAECPHVGADTSCAILIEIDDNGAQILTDGSKGPYDGVEDTLVGVLNNTTSTTITSIPLTGTLAVFGFDGDGACDPNNNNVSFSPGPPDAYPSNSGLSGHGCLDNPVDTTGYGGPNSHFTNINAAKTSGTVNFNVPLAPGQTTWFSLEERITGTDINIISGTSGSISAVEGNQFSGQVATFSSTDKTTTASQYSATIDWGDGTAVTPGTVSGGSGSFTVSGMHTYADENDATQATITITDKSNGNTTTVQSPVSVADAQLTAGTLNVTGGTEGVSPGTASFTFTDANPLATTADFTATIDWGDSTTTTETVTGPTGGPFTISDSHQYAEEGPYTVTVNVADDGGSNTSSTGTANVADAPLTSSCAAAGTSPQSFNGPTATFNDTNSSGAAADFTAGVTINWGDGSPTTSGSISGGPGLTPYTVSGNHVYAATGIYTITTTVTDDGGSTTTTSPPCKVVVFAFAPGGGSFVIGDLNSTVGTSVTFWGAQWWKLNSLSGGAAPAAFKGFALNPKTPTCNTGWSTDPGNSAPPPAGPLPAFMAVIVSSSTSKSGSQISGNTPHIVVVQTNPGYDANPGHAGTGKVVAQVC